MTCPVKVCGHFSKTDFTSHSNVVWKDRLWIWPLWVWVLATRIPLVPCQAVSFWVKHVSVSSMVGTKLPDHVSVSSMVGTKLPDHRSEGLCILAVCWNGPQFIYQCMIGGCTGNFVLYSSTTCAHFQKVFTLVFKSGMSCRFGGHCLHYSSKAFLMTETSSLKSMK